MHIVALSLTGCILFTLKSRNPAFFLMPLRGWEFMAGGAIGLALPASNRLAGNGDRDAMCAYTRTEIEAQRTRTVAMLQEAARRFPNVRYTDPIGGFCDATVCRPYDGDTALFADNNHLSMPGAQRLYAAVSADFEWEFAETNRTSGATSRASNCSGMH
jgi:hypothetical protein